MSVIKIEDLPEVQSLSAEEQQLLFGAGRRKPSRSGLMGAEPLEVRQVMTAAVSASVVKQVLEVEGTDTSDSIRISQSASTITVRNMTTNRDVGSFPVSSVRSVRVHGLAGNDTIDLRGNGNPVRLPSQLYGDAGNDTIYGGRGDDLIAGDLDADGDTWSPVDGSANDLAIGADGSIWAIGAKRVGGGYTILKRVGNSWKSVDGGALRIAVDPKGNPWVVNDQGSIYRRVGEKWIQQPGSAKDIGIGKNGQVWVIGTDKQGGGHGIHRWTGSGWQRVEGGGVRISVDPNGNPWVLNSDKNIYRRVGDKWQNVEGKANDIGVGADGSVWVIGTNQTGANGFGVYRWNGNSFSAQLGAATQIAVDPEGIPWVANGAQSIFRGDVVGNDTLYGGNGDDEIYGGRGVDTLFGEAGMDWLDAGTSAEQVNPGKVSDAADTDWNAQQWAIGGTSYLDIEQESSNTCVLLSSLANACQHISLVNRFKYLGNHMYRVEMTDPDRGAVTEDVWFDGKMVRYNGVLMDPAVVTPGEFWTILYQRAYLQHFEQRQVNGVTKNFDGSNKVFSIQFRNASDVKAVGYAVSLFHGERGAHRAYVAIWGATATSKNELLTPKQMQDILSRGDMINVDERRDDAWGNVSAHAYAVWKVFQEKGVWKISLFNPWKLDDTLNDIPFKEFESNSDGFITLNWSDFDDHFFRTTYSLKYMFSVPKVNIPTIKFV